MRKLVVAAILLLCLFIFSRQSFAVYGESYDICRVKIEKHLTKVKSPMVTAVPTFVEASRRHNLDCYLLPAIAGVESSFGKAVRRGSYNPFGWGNGRIRFQSWDQAIEVVANGLGQKYVQRWGARTPEQIGRYYAADPRWPRKVRANMAEMQKQPLP